MALVVLLRGVNVGGKRFSPAKLAKDLADLDATSLGAAGSFVVRGKVAQAALRERVAEALPFECEILVVPAAKLRAAMEAGGSIRVPDGARRFATAMAGKPASKPKLPLDAPPKGAWGVRVVAVEGPFALGVRRSVASTGVYPNEVVEKAFGVRATTRDWPTMERLAALVG